MRIKIISKILSVVIVVLLFSVTIYSGDDKNGTKTYQPTGSQLSKIESGKVGSAYRLFINNINLPLNYVGALAEVNIPDPNPTISGAGGKFAGDVALFSGGFFLSGTSAGNMFANAVAPSSLVQDYVAGDVANGQNDSRAQLYVLKSSDAPFSQSWIDWKDAVNLGADFYDGDNDGIYNPIDKNGDGLWQADEDRPDLIGDETVWCVYSDGQPSSKRRWNTVAPLGIEIRQTVFAFASAGAIGNIIFVRYRFKYVGFGGANEPNSLADCYFGVWADPDIGDAYDDLLGCDTLRNSGFVYNKGSDNNPAYGTQPPAFLIDFFQGPISYIPGETYTDVNSNGTYDEGVDTPLDTAYSVRGEIKGLKIYPGAKNLGISSFVMYKNGDPTINDPSIATEARHYTLGLTRLGDAPNPCTFSYGQVLGGVDCNLVNPRFWFSGDPVTNTGWINTLEGDYRMMSNTGPFTLTKGDEKEIVVAYVFGKGSDALNSVTVAKRIDDGAQNIFNNNFIAPSSPPIVNPTISSSENFIDLVWDTKEQVTYRSKTATYDIRFKGYNVFAYKTNSTVELISGQDNKALIATYQAADSLNNIYIEDGNTGGKFLLYAASPNKLDSALYSTDATGRIRLRITKDPFTGSNLVKGKPYYFAITSYAVNYDALVNKDNPNLYGRFGDYYLPASSFVTAVENVPKIYPVTLGEDQYNPPLDYENTNVSTTGPSGSQLQYDVIDKQALTGDEYKVTFKIDSSASRYSTFWKLENVTKGTTLQDSSKLYLDDDPSIAAKVTDGFIVRLPIDTAALGNLTAQTSSPWYNSANSRFYYVSSDIYQSSKILTLPGLNGLYGKFVRADRLRRVELKFGENGKAYRYLNGFKGTPIQRRNRYLYAEGIVAADTVGLGTVGQLGVGFVDVPFTAWVEDFATTTGGYGEKRQLAVGFIERAGNDGGIPDGTWNGTNIDTTLEYILIFDADYDPTGSEIIYKGGFVSGTNTVWADLRGGTNYPVPPGANVTDRQRKIAASPYFNTLYVVGVEKNNSSSNFSNGDKFVIPVTDYPFTPKDEFIFKTTTDGLLTSEEEKSLFDKVNVFPNPMYGFNVATGYTNSPSDEPFVTFSNLPNEVTIKIFSLSGTLIRTLDQTDKTSLTSPFLNWNLQNENGIRAASGLYLAIVSSPKFGDKLLKFSIIMPQKQLQRY
jgi:hypothetical protein